MHAASGDVQVILGSEGKQGTWASKHREERCLGAFSQGWERYFHTVSVWHKKQKNQLWQSENRPVAARYSSGFSESSSPK